MTDPATPIDGEPDARVDHARAEQLSVVDELLERLRIAVGVGRDDDGPFRSTSPTHDEAAARARAWDALERRLQLASDWTDRSNTANANARTTFYFLTYFFATASAIVTTYVTYAALYQNDVYLRIKDNIVVTLAVPVGVGMILTTLSFIAATSIQRRGNSDFLKSLDQISRLWREGFPDESGGRFLAQVLEETLLNARGAFTLQLRLSRALFVLGIVLFAVSIATFFASNNSIESTVVPGISSLGTLAAAAIFNPERRISSSVARITQLMTVLGGYTRHMTTLAKYADKAIEDARNTSSIKDDIEFCLTKMDGALDRAFDLLQTTVNLGDKDAQNQILHRIAKSVESMSSSR